MQNHKKIFLFTAKSNSADDLPLTKTLEMHSTIKVVRSVFTDANKYYP